MQNQDMQDQQQQTGDRAVPKRNNALVGLLLLIAGGRAIGAAGGSVTWCPDGLLPGQ